MKISYVSLVVLLLAPVLLYGEMGECPVYNNVPPVVECVAGSILSIECAEQIITNFSVDNWFIYHNLSELTDQDMAFLRGYLIGRRLELWGELGTPAMVSRQRFIFPIKTGSMLFATAVGLAAASFTAGSISASGADSSLLAGYLNDSVLATVFLGLSCASGLYYTLLYRMASIFNEKRSRLQSVEELLNIIEG